MDRKPMGDKKSRHLFFLIKEFIWEHPYITATIVIGTIISICLIYHFWDELGEVISSPADQLHSINTIIKPYSRSFDQKLLDLQINTDLTQIGKFLEEEFSCLLGLKCAIIQLKGKVPDVDYTIAFLRVERQFRKVIKACTDVGIEIDLKPLNLEIMMKLVLQFCQL
jgi:hypothetical protein